MARSLNGNLLGKAARTDLYDNLFEEDDYEYKTYMEIVDELRILLKDDFEIWYDSFPETILKRDFKKIMIEKIKELKKG